MLKRSPKVLRCPGESRFNPKYFCTVHEVREVGENSVEIDFTVQGDGSMGKLQKSNASVLEWHGDGGRKGTGSTRPDSESVSEVQKGELKMS